MRLQFDKAFVILGMCGVLVSFNTFAGFAEGVAALKRRDYATGIGEMRLLANQGNPHAQYILGKLIGEGKGAPQDFKEALKWIRLAAAQGNADAQFDLATLFQDGRGVPQDFKEAEKFYRLAAQQGHTDAQYNLGKLLEDGLGVPQNFRESIKWYLIAAELGNASAQNNLGAMFEYGKGVQANRVLAYALYQVSAANEPSGKNKASLNASRLEQTMSSNDVKTAKSLAREMSEPSNFMKVFGQVTKKANG